MRVIAIRLTLWGMKNETVSASRMGSDRIALSRAEAAQATGSCQGFIDLEIRRGNLRAVKRGRKVFILREELLRYLGVGDV